MNDDKFINKRSRNRNLVLVLVVVAVMLIDVLIGIGMYNTPANQLNRHLKLANRYLEELDYEQAVVEFDKAIRIDSVSAEAYLGKAEAYVGLDDYGMACETLEEINDRLIELGKDNNEVIADLSKYLGSYIDTLMKEEKFDDVRMLIEKYKDIVITTDFSEVLSRINELEQEDIQTKEVMQTKKEVQMERESRTEEEVDLQTEAENIAGEDSEEEPAVKEETQDDQNFVASEEDRIYTDDQLCEMALQYYADMNGYMPGHAMVDYTNGDMVVIHLYDAIDGHTATSDWYEVNRYTGAGMNFKGEAIDLSIVVKE